MIMLAIALFILFVPVLIIWAHHQYLEKIKEDQDCIGGEDDGEWFIG